MLDELARLSTDASSEGRRRLLNAVTDLFLHDDEPSEEAQEHFSDIATHSLGKMEAPDRKDYADRVAAEPQLPRKVANTLANDPDAEVAKLVLKLSPVLTDADLAAIAVNHSQAHLLAIAERATLSENVTDILVDRGDKQVLRTVSGNEGAAFSDRGFERLVERGANDAGVRKNLETRRENLPVSQARRVLQIAAHAANKAEPGHQVELISGEAPKRVVREARERRLELKLLIADLKDGRRTIDDVVTILARDDRAFDLAQVISTFSEIQNAQALRALLQPESSGIAVACKALGLGAEAFRKVLELRTKRLGLLEASIDVDVTHYQALPAETSERAMRFLKVRSKVS
ncbi:DUF2336 domain-containing protein [Salinarimonas ramus]|uniref:DUF2336 domain-containing protein n=1 Tax=Salinarimonas ramus TaxID=690164 RepID=A0A917QDU7_9HYPH|nr:DUF2336 domain-containing protein [Salinarimonas ramus]GGK44235.1 hypothetical protein GCM10011322_34240 [Salinarimonas ramus]